MLEVIQEVCEERALYDGEAKAAGRQGGEEELDLDLVKGLPEGIKHKHSKPFILRDNARTEEKKFKEQEKLWWLG